MREKNYPEKIITFLTQTTEPVDVEKIRIACHIGNWNTALTHCLDLLVQGKIQGQKTSKGWVFWTLQETSLEPWQEAIGNLEDLKISEDRVTVTLSRIVRSFAITFPKETLEAQTLIQTLKKTPKGTKIALLKTDIPEKPLIIKPLTKQQSRSRRFYRICGFVKVVALFYAVCTSVNGGV